MIKASEAALKELIHFRNGAFLKFLKEARQDALERCAKAPKDAVEMIQGEAATLQKMISLIEEARKELDSREKPRQQMSNAF